ncbi:50S ribosomal protein L10, chloroplastic [Tanacetum coccineum]
MINHGYIYVIWTQWEALEPCTKRMNAWLFVHSEEILAMIKPCRIFQKEKKLEDNDISETVFEGKYSVRILPPTPEDGGHWSALQRPDGSSSSRFTYCIQAAGLNVLQSTTSFCELKSLVLKQCMLEQTSASQWNPTRSDIETIKS